ncbi:hypothetical protein KEG38_41975 [Polyangium jinanense]|uniref:Uncharacterized protein n=1 Tax=Polyangium jinanense TaxID=2829994 RepID=A0A9X3XCE4_9BACT|nr:hypothetical protein [Polyangium jinanense]MDC3960497.1 hypothetical protein [Polyangium jinanense]MDC3986730.1 hypothetical protein [Polyangium jinanense]
MADDSERLLGVPFDDLLVTVIETKFPWLHAGRVVWARTQDWKQALFWVKPDGEVRHLNGPDGLANLSRMLVESTGPLPKGLPPIKLAEATRQLTFEPRGQVASREFLQRVRPYMANWLAEDNPQSRKLFEEQCEDPALHQQGHGWTLLFRCFNVKGGVELWTVKGDESHVAETKKTLVCPAGTFVWPMA